MDDLEHFAPKVPKYLQIKLLEIVNRLKEDYISEWSIHHKEPCGLSRVDEVSGVSFSGFIPFQNGGFVVSEFYQNGWASGNYFTEGERKFNEKQYDNMRASFFEDHKIDHVPSDLIDEYESYENEYFQDMEVILRVYLVVERQDRYNDNSDCSHVRVTLACNYKDAPYYRDKYEECMKEIEFSIENFMTLTCDDLIKQLRNR